MGLENKENIEQNYLPVKDLLAQGYKRMGIFSEVSFDEAAGINEQMYGTSSKIGIEENGTFSIFVLPEEKSASEQMLMDAGVPITISEETRRNVSEVMGEDAGRAGTNGRR